MSSVKVQGSGGQGCDLELDEGERERSGKAGSKPLGGDSGTLLIFW